MHFVFAIAISSLVLCHTGRGEVSQSDYKQDESFQSWCAEFCESVDERYLASIYTTWRRNADFVAEQNQLGLPYSLSLNQFAHLNQEDFSKHHLHQLKREETEHIPLSSEVYYRDPPPDSVDWRSKGVVPPVQNQGPCGDDVAFQIVHVVDCFHAIQTGDLELASIKEYWDCCGDGACNGGLYDEDNYNCIVRIGGLALASEYESPDHKCLNGSFKPVVKIDGGKFITTKNETVMEYAVAMQPVVAAIDASHASFQLYESGVYYDPDCSQEELDHVILVVGYGTTEDGQEYWICQNSWGTSWGMQGYVLMARNRGNNCGIASDISYPF